MKQIITCLIIIILSFTLRLVISQNVAVIGKGLGGALCSYFLHKKIPGIKIDVYNHQPKKEMMFINITFNSKNLYLKTLITQKNVLTGYNDGTYIIKDNDEFYSSDIKKSAGYETFHEALKEFIMKQLQIFKKIYIHQKNGLTFKTVRELLKSLSTDFENYYMNETTENLLIKKNPFIAANPDIQKYIKNGLACNFTNTNIHGFAGLAFLMFSEIIEELQQVIPHDLFIKSLFHTDDKTIEKDVSKIVHENNQNYVISIDGKQTFYNYIILATTTAADVIEFIGFPDPIKIFKYRDSHILNVTGRLSKKFHNILEDLYPICDIHSNRIYTQINFRNTTHFSINALQQLSENDILQFIKKPKIKCNDPVHSSPDYTTENDESLRNAKFELAENLYNAHALHSLGMFDEMLAIGAKNIALLIKTQIKVIGKFPDEQNHTGKKDGTSTVVGKITSNRTFVGRSASGQRASSNTVKWGTTLTSDKTISSGARTNSSSVRQKIKTPGSRKSRG